MNEQPKVLVLTPMKNAADCLPRYVELLEQLDWPRALLSVGILEGDSSDGTREALAEMRPRLESRCARVSITHHDYGFALPPGVPRWEPSLQLVRRKILARARNRLLMNALADEDWVLWIDADMVSYPRDIITTLIGTGFDIVTPHAVLVAGGESFDRNAWADHGRTLLHDKRGDGPVRLDAVGGTMLLVRADLHRDGLVFPPFPYGVRNGRIRERTVWGAGEIETEGLGIMAADMGVQCWGLPDLEVFHRPA